MKPNAESTFSFIDTITKLTLRDFSAFKAEIIAAEIYQTGIAEGVKCLGSEFA